MRYGIDGGLGSLIVNAFFICNEGDCAVHHKPPRQRPSFNSLVFRDNSTYLIYGRHLCVCAAACFPQRETIGPLPSVEANACSTAVDRPHSAHTGLLNFG